MGCVISVPPDRYLSPFRVAPGPLEKGLRALDEMLDASAQLQCPLPKPPFDVGVHEKPPEVDTRVAEAF